MSAKIMIGQDAAEVSKHLCQQIEDRFNASVGSLGSRPFVIGLSGGSLPKFFAMGVAGMKVDWAKVKFVFCDERLVPFDNADSTYKIYKEQFVDKNIAGLGEDNFVVIDPSLKVEAAAEDYAGKLKALDSPPAADGPWPCYDVLLLGMGPDGHTCSLFPGHALLDNDSCVVAPIADSPKPPPERITLTLPVLNSAKACVFVCTGDGKKQLVREILQVGGDEARKYPAARVKPDKGDLVWILDAAAAANLEQK